MLSFGCSLSIVSRFFQRYAKYTKDEENAEKRKDMEAFEEMVYDFEIEIKSLLLVRPELTQMAFKGPASLRVPC